MLLDKLVPVNLRQVWSHETTDFSHWLSQNENLDILGDEIGMDLDIIKREALAGRYRVDILSKDKLTNEIVIIENQLENTDHSHLGQLITYSSHYNAKTIVWVVRDLRIEHEKAIEWLNRNLSDEIKIFLVKIELFKIGDSLPAPKFSLLSKPYGWTNTRQRKAVEIEKFPENFVDYERICQSIIKSSLINFLNKFAIPEKTYKRRELLEKYSLDEKNDSKYYIQHPNQFKKVLISWAKLNKLVVNKLHQNEKHKGVHKSGGVEYITFNQE
ncbi:hypothetical protein [Paludibacter sp.]|uniref:hypothetical protein n=1 Tax=Paludibacter sp. TaxID=1898105 RepID=UPI001354278A|nr:hypothetical protein [Paludibacter sp.]MTK53546.1 hypothetical protein [Paludibacter sp.]